MKKMMTILLVLFYHTVSFARHSFSVPIELNTGYAEPFAIASFKIKIGALEFPLLVDTGFASDHDFVLSKALADKLNLKYTGKQECRMSQSGKTCFEEAFLPSFQLEDQTFSSSSVLVFDQEWGGAQFLKNFNKSDAYKNGVVTLGFLKKFNLIFDYNNKKIIFYDKNNFEIKRDVSSWSKIKFDLESGNIETSFQYADKIAKFVWDTALIPSCIKKDLVRFSEPLVQCNDKIYFDLGLSKDELCINSKYFKINNSDFMTHELVVLDKSYLPNEIPLDGFIGSDFINTHTVYIDFKSNILFIK